MKKPFVLIAAIVAVAVIAVPAAAAGVHKYHTNVTINHEGGAPDPILWHGWVKSEVGGCERGRRVILFKQRPGADRRVGAARRLQGWGQGAWGLHAQPDGRAYVKVKRKVRNDGDVCLADRSPTHIHAISGF